jgi:hypothetical protein
MADQPVVQQQRRSDVTSTCCDQGSNRTLQPTARIQLTRKIAFGSGGRTTTTGLLLTASHPCGISSYSLTAKLLPNDALIDEDVIIPCDPSSSLEVSWEWNEPITTGPQRAIRPQTATILRSALAPSLPPLLNRMLFIEGNVVSCCESKMSLVFGFFFVTLDYPILATTDYTPTA